ncbi:GNAT family N-acetyltransferase [Pyxidicoccus fallax]|uniref:GNAT family N-acetyltransferase n=1 Tax=Pyxidicoccus fallax TaxID=394095 RepID=A0A848LBX7_9BACT|nr:GNAT family protein [Pyxidicoccus fallax]NMO15742.1 GNAT family N-acetyltransferase [Pyxidicoccus fallax]NPC85248.1 GNAT family N-acetyltransferase [Pyxidicoccus fallax]
MSEWSHIPILEGRHVRLEPLRVEHVEALSLAVTDGKLWDCWYTSVPRPEGMAGYVETALAMKERGQALPFVVRDAGGEVVGSTRLYQLDPQTPRLSIGYTWYAKRVQRTGLNTEAKLLLLTHAFEKLKCAAVGFETSWFNHASRTAIARLGAKQDGVLRNHLRHSDGSLRDTVVFSILEAEWPAVRRHLRAKLEVG